MARLSDHDVRDAEHALRAEIALIVGRYTRRMLEMGKAHIQEALEMARGEEYVDGTAIGREAAARSAFPYFGATAPPPAIESGGDYSDEG
jgi:hypothetical protein